MKSLYGGFLSAFYRKKPNVQGATLKNNKGSVVGARETTKINKIFNPSALQKPLFGKSYNRKFGMLTRAGELQRAKNRATRAKINTQKYTVIAERAKKASVKYAECGCDQLKKDMDANKAGFFTKLWSRYTGDTLSGIAETKAQVKEQQLVRATENYEKEFKENQEKQVRAGALSRELADKAIKEFQEHVKEVKDGAREAGEIARKAASQQRKSETSAKGAFQQKRFNAAVTKSIELSSEAASRIDAKVAAAAAAAKATAAAEEASELEKKKAGITGRRIAAAAAAAAEMGAMRSKLRKHALSPTAPLAPLKMTQTRRGSNNNNPGRISPEALEEALHYAPSPGYTPPSTPRGGGHRRGHATRRR
jgi:hypothetical protein